MRTTAPIFVFTLMSLVGMMLVSTVSAFSIVPSSPSVHQTRTLMTPSITTGTTTNTNFIPHHQQQRDSSTTRLYMSDRERTRTTKKGVQTIIKDKTETKAEEQKKKEEMWRVVLHNDEVHTFNYVVRSLCKGMYE